MIKNAKSKIKKKLHVKLEVLSARVKRFNICEAKALIQDKKKLESDTTDSIIQHFMKPALGEKIQRDRS